MLTPRVFTNHNRQLLTPADLDNHPLAQEYIEYTRHMHYPCDFKEWLFRREQAKKNAAEVDRIRVCEAAAEPFCQSPLKVRRWKR